MDNLLEILLPLIFFAIYFGSQFFGKKGEEEDDGKPAFVSGLHHTMLFEVSYCGMHDVCQAPDSTYHTLVLE